MLERKKFCPVCGGLAAVLDGNPGKYGDKSVSWNAFIRVKYCSDECRELMKRQDTLLSNRKRRRERKAYRDALMDAVDALREEVRVSREEVRVSREETRLSRNRIAELEARV